MTLADVYLIAYNSILVVGLVLCVLVVLAVFSVRCATDGLWCW